MFLQRSRDHWCLVFNSKGWAPVMRTESNDVLRPALESKSALTSRRSFPVLADAGCISRRHVPSVLTCRDVTVWDGYSISHLAYECKNYLGGLAHMSTEDDPDETRERSSTSIIVALIGAGAVIVAAVIGLLANRSTTGPPSAMPQVPGPTSQTSETLPSSSSPPSTSFVPIVQILEPTKDKSVGYEAGTEVKGNAFNLGNKSLWLFQLSESPRGGVAYYIASDLIPVVNGEWSTQVNQIGSPDGQRELITFVAALADQDCVTMIKDLQAKLDDDQYFQDSLPPGCDVAASFRVVKDHA